MAMAIFKYGKPVMAKCFPTASYAAGDVVVIGGVPFVAHVDNPSWVSNALFPDAFGALGGIYTMLADAAYAVGSFVFWDSVLQQVTAQTGANRVAFGMIVGGPLGNTNDGGPTGAGSYCDVLHLPEPEMRFGNATFTAGAFSAFNDEGNIYRVIGNPVAQNAADLTDDILSGVVIAANAFDITGRGLAIQAQGKLGATANNKRIKIWANPTMAGQTVTNGVVSGGTVTGVGAGALLFDSGVQTGNAIGWEAFLEFFKYGAAGSNTQYFQSNPIFGTAHGGIGVPQFSTLPENAQISIVVTGSSPTTGAAGDVVLNMLQLNAMN